MYRRTLFYYDILIKIDIWTRYIFLIKSKRASMAQYSSLWVRLIPIFPIKYPDDSNGNDEMSYWVMQYVSNLVNNIFTKC